MGIAYLIASALCLIVIVKVTSIVRHYFVLRRKLKDIPSTPTMYPFFGDTLSLIKRSEVERTQWYIENTSKFPDGIGIVWFGMKPFIDIHNPKYLEVILPSILYAEKDMPYDLMSPWLGNGLLTSSGPQWFHDRRMIGPAFHFNILEEFTVIFSKKAEFLTTCLEKAIEKNPEKAINVFPFALNVALDVICETAMGVNINKISESSYTSTVQRTSTLTLERLYQPWYWILWLYYLSPKGKEYKKLINTLHGFTREVISKKKAARRSKSNYAKLENKEKVSDDGEKKRKVFLDLLLDQNEQDDAPLSDDELRAQVDTFMFEGHDTTGVALTWALLCLGNNLEYQEKIHRELEDVFGDSQAPATINEILQLKYLDRAIKEALRLFPSVPLITRILKEDLKLGKYSIPKDNIVLLSIFMLHRDPKVWPDPLKYDPDRFLSENCKQRSPYAYIPFSAGPRNCIGQRFAQIEEKIILTAVLRKWRMRSVKALHEVEFSGSLILRPTEEVLIHFTPKK